MLCLCWFHGSCPKLTLLILFGKFLCNYLIFFIPCYFCIHLFNSSSKCCLKILFIIFSLHLIAYLNFFSILLKENYSFWLNLISTKPNGAPCNTSSTSPAQQPQKIGSPTENYPNIFPSVTPLHHQQPHQNNINQRRPTQNPSHFLSYSAFHSRLLDQAMDLLSISPSSSSTSILSPHFLSCSKPFCSLRGLGKAPLSLKIFSNFFFKYPYKSLRIKILCSQFFFF